MSLLCPWIAVLGLGYAHFSGVLVDLLHVRWSNRARVPFPECLLLLGIMVKDEGLLVQAHLADRPNLRVLVA